MARGFRSPSAFCAPLIGLTHRRRARHTRRLFSRPLRDRGGGSGRCAAGLSAAGAGAGRDRLSRPDRSPTSPTSSASSAFPPSRESPGRQRSALRSGNSSWRRGRWAPRMLRILVRELLPNVFLPLLAFFLLAVAVTIVVEGALSFLGLGVPPPIAELGQHDRGGAREPGDRARLAFMPAADDVPHRAVVQSGRRHVAGGHRSAPGRAVMANAAPASCSSCCRSRTSRSICRRHAEISARWLRSSLKLGGRTARSALSASLAAARPCCRGRSLQLLPRKAKLSGRVLFDGQDLRELAAGSRCAGCAAVRWPSCSRTR